MAYKIKTLIPGNEPVTVGQGKTAMSVQKVWKTAVKRKDVIALFCDEDQILSYRIPWSLKTPEIEKAFETL